MDWCPSARHSPRELTRQLCREKTTLIGRNSNLNTDAAVQHASWNPTSTSTGTGGREAKLKRTRGLKDSNNGKRSLVTGQPGTCSSFSSCMATSVMHVCRPGGSDMASFVGKGSAVVPVWHFSFLLLSETVLLMRKLELRN